MTKMYCYMNESGTITLSAHSEDSPMWENNHISIAEVGRGHINKHKSALNILSNVLFQAGIQLIVEE